MYIHIQQTSGCLRQNIFDKLHWRIFIDNRRQFFLRVLS